MADSDDSSADSQGVAEPGPASSASIAHESLTTASVATQWSTLMPWLVLATATALMGGAAWSLGVMSVALSFAGVTGAAGAKIILGRRRRVRLQADRLVEDTLLGTTEVRLKEIHTVKAAGGHLRAPAAHPLSAEHLGFASDEGCISFADLEPQAALLLSKAVLQTVAPRLVDEFVDLLARGRSVPFGPHLLATPAGLVDVRLPLCTLRWSEIERVDTTPAGVRIFAIDRPDQTLTLPTWTDNAVLLEALIQRQQHEPPSAHGEAAVCGWALHHSVGGPLVCGVERSGVLLWAVFGLALVAGLGAAVWLGAEAFAAVAGVLTVLGGLSAATAVVVQRKRAFAVYEQGVADSGGFIAFDDVVHLKRSIVDQYANGGFVGRSVTLVLTHRSGRRVRLRGSGDRIEAVAAAALRRALPALVDKARRIVAQGGSVHAGSFVVDEQGVHTKAVEVGWDDIESVVVESGCLHIWRRGLDRSVLALSLDQTDALVVMELVGERLQQARHLHLVEAAPLRDLFATQTVNVGVGAEVGVNVRR